jgi:spore maturation protein CgeB
MNWEAFAAKSLLITNPTKALEEQGFRVNIDYLDIEDFLNPRKVHIPSDEEIRRIAENGYDKFIRFTKNSYLYY